MKLTPEELARISELLETSVSTSAEQIAQLSQTGWDIVSASVKELTRTQALALQHDKTESSLGARLKSRSLVPMEILILYPGSSVAAIADAIAAAGSPRMRALPERNKVILGEVSNILGQGVIRAMVDAFRISLILTVPELIEGFHSDIVAKVFSEFNEGTGTLLLSHVQMSCAALSAECSLLLFIDTALLRRMLGRVAEQG